MQPAGKVEDRAHNEVVLLIENDHAIANMYALGLNLSGYQVRIASSANSALSEVSRLDHRPELIVLDLEQPRVSGLDVLNDLKASPAAWGLPVIVLADDEEELCEAYRLGATDCHPRYRTTPRQLVSYVGAALTEGNRMRSP